MVICELKSSFLNSTHSLLMWVWGEGNLKYHMSSKFEFLLCYKKGFYITCATTNARHRVEIYYDINVCNIEIHDLNKKKVKTHSSA